MSTSMPVSSKPSSLLRSLAEAWSSRLLISNTVWALAGYGLRLVIQAALFIIIARCLGVKQYGGFIGATALIGVLSPFVGLGSGFVLIKNVARDKTLFAEYWGNGLLVTMISGVGLFVACLFPFTLAGEPSMHWASTTSGSLTILANPMTHPSTGTIPPLLCFTIAMDVRTPHY